MKIYIFLIISIFTYEIQTKRNCHSQLLLNCIQNVFSFSNANGMPFPRNIQELNEQCEIFRDGRNCMYNYSIECMTLLERTLGDFLFTSTVHKMNDWCNPDHETHKAYLRNSKCITENYEGVETCAKPLMATVEIMSSAIPDERLLTFCCAYSQFRDCLFEHYERTCNKESAGLIRMITEIAVSDAVIEICNGSKVSATKCPVLPTAGDLKATYKNHLVGTLLGRFIRE